MYYFDIKNNKSTVIFYLIELLYFFQKNKNYNINIKII